MAPGTGDQARARDDDQASGQQRAERLGYERLRRFVESGFDVLLLLDSDLMIEWVSSNVVQQFGFDPDYLLGKGTWDLFMTVNLSALELDDRDLVSDTRAVLDASGIDARRVAFEITESVLMDDVERSLHTLQALHDLGVRLFVDDFGTGYSSLAYLQRFPVDVLKIDQSFLAGAETSDETPALVAAIITLAHALGLEVTAEGVEHDHQLDLLSSLGCDHVQGFHLGRPAPADTIGPLLARGRLLDG